MKTKTRSLRLVLMALAAQIAWGQATSRVIPFNNVVTTMSSAPGQPLVLQLWDAPSGGNLVFNEAQTLDVSEGGSISFVLGALTSGGLDPAKFPSGSSRYLDVVDATGTSVLPNPPGRIPLTAVAFSISPGPKGDTGDKGDTGAQGVQGPPGQGSVIQVNSGPGLTGGPIVTTGTLSLDTGFTDTRYPRLFAPNTFNADQTIQGSLNLVGAAALRLPSNGVITLGGSPFLHNFGNLSTFLGANAGNFTMTGGGNVAVGSGNPGNLSANTTGIDNTAIGRQVLASNTTGNFNTASGVLALFSNTLGHANVAAGSNALDQNTEGTSNVAIGSLAGRTGTVANANKTGSNNTFIGFSSGPGTSTQLNNATAIGANAHVSASNALVLGNGVNVGIGTETPAEAVDVVRPDATLRLFNTNDPGGTFVGNTFASLEMGLFNPSTTTAWGAIPPGVKRSAFGIQNSGSGRITVGSLINNFGNPVFRNVLDDGNGNMGIGTATPTANLEVNGTAKFDQPVTFAPDQSFTQNFILVSAAGSPGQSDITCPADHPHVISGGGFVQGGGPYLRETRPLLGLNGWRVTCVNIVTSLDLPCIQVYAICAK